MLPASEDAALAGQATAAEISYGFPAAREGRNRVDGREARGSVCGERCTRGSWQAGCAALFLFCGGQGAARLLAEGQGAPAGEVGSFVGRMQ